MDRHRPACAEGLFYLGGAYVAVIVKSLPDPEGVAQRGFGFGGPVAVEIEPPQVNLSQGNGRVRRR